MKQSLTLIFGLFYLMTFVQTPKIEVLTLGTFHFNFPNLDVAKTDKNEQIDVLEPKYQKEIEDIVKRIAIFKPTIIAIEREPSKQAKYDSVYNKYLLGEYKLRRNEEEQIGFRLAKSLGIKKLYCVDSDGRYFEEINKVLKVKDTIIIKKVNFPRMIALNYDRYLLFSFGYQKFGTQFVFDDQTGEMLLAPIDTTLSSDEERKMYNVETLSELLKKYKLKTFLKE